MTQHQDKVMCVNWTIQTVSWQEVSMIQYLFKLRLLCLWRAGMNARRPPMWPGFGSGPVPYEVWVWCWYSPCSEGFFLRVLRFSSLDQNQHSNSNTTSIEGPHENQLRLMWLSKYCNFFLFILLMPLMPLFVFLQSILSGGADNQLIIYDVSGGGWRRSERDMEYQSADTTWPEKTEETFCPIRRLRFPPQFFIRMRV